MTNEQSPTPDQPANDANPAASLTAASQQLEAATASLNDAAKQIATSTQAAATNLTEAAKQVEAAAEAAAAKLLAESTTAHPFDPPVLLDLPKLDEYIEDLIDPEYGTRSSREVVRAAADKMLAGFKSMLVTNTPPTPVAITTPVKKKNDPPAGQ
jgi:hypothetical protein